MMEPANPSFSPTIVFIINMIGTFDDVFNKPSFVYLILNMTEIKNTHSLLVYFLYVSRYFLNALNLLSTVECINAYLTRGDSSEI